MSDPIFTTRVTNPFGLSDVGYLASPSFVDIDNDGDLDALVGEWLTNDSPVFFRNIGTANNPVFTTSGGNPFGLIAEYSSPDFADIDGDGDFDAFIGNYDGNILFYRNTGTASTPVFSSPRTNPFGLTDVGGNAAPTFVDIDNDGDLDAFVGEYYGNTLFYRNTGTANTPVFASPRTNPFGFKYIGMKAKPTFSDIDGDGDLDAFVGDFLGDTLLYRNTGTANSPVFANPVTNPFGLKNVGNGFFYADPTLVDIDGDGDLDAFVGDGDGNMQFYKQTASVTVGFSIKPITPQNTSESGKTAIYRINLNTAPMINQNVVITFTSSDTSEGIINNPTLTFTSANYATPQTLKVRGVGDNLDDGNIPYSVTAQVTTLDVFYKKLTIAPFNLTNIDDGLDKALDLKGDKGGSKIDVLSGNNGADTLHGLNLDDNLSGGIGNDTLYGGYGEDNLFGEDGDDQLFGEQGDDYMDGGAGNDLLSGGLGNDNLIGGSGQDSFLFDTALKANIDKITDFNPIDDTIQLDNAVFTKLGATGVLNSDYFIKASAAIDPNDYIIYNPATGAVSYDADGNGSGVGVQMVLLGVNLSLTNEDFVIM